MAEISNRVLAALLIVAIVVSLSGTLVSLNQIKSFSSPLTGMVTDTGEVTLNISDQVGIVFTTAYNTINFGTGYVNTTNQNANNCTMNISGTIAAPVAFNYSNQFCCGDWSGQANDWWDSETPLELENTGTTYLNVSLNSNASAWDFIPSQATGVEEFKWLVVDDEAGSCNQTPVPATFTNVTKTGTVYTVCPCLNSSTGRNELAIGIEVVVPIDPTTTGQTQKAQLTATATKMTSGECGL